MTKTNKRNELLKRMEITRVVEAVSNPGLAKSRTEVAGELKVAEDCVVIHSIRSQFGSHDFTIEASIYDSVSDKERIEPRVKAAKKVAQ